MVFLAFLRDTPVVAFFLLLVLLITVVPLGAAFYRKRRLKESDGKATGEAAMPPKVPAVRFLGPQLDLAALLLGLMLLLAVIGWLRKAFF